MIALRALALSALLLANCGRPVQQPTTIDGGILGEVTVFSPGDHPTDLVFLLSDAGGWSERMRDALPIGPQLRISLRTGVQKPLMRPNVFFGTRKSCL